MTVDKILLGIYIFTNLGWALVLNYLNDTWSKNLIDLNEDWSKRLQNLINDNHKNSLKFIEKIQTINRDGEF